MKLLVGYIKFRLGLFLLKLRVYRTTKKEKRPVTLYHECMRYVTNYDNMRLIFPELDKTSSIQNLGVYQNILPYYFIKFVPITREVVLEYESAQSPRRSSLVGRQPCVIHY